METTYKGYVINQKDNNESHCALIYRNGELVKCIAGDIFENDGVYSNNAIEKSKKYIDDNFFYNRHITKIVMIKSFVEFKRQLIALKKYSKNSVINDDTFRKFTSKLFDKSGTKITLTFETNDEVANLFNRICKAVN